MFIQAIEAFRLHSGKKKMIADSGLKIIDYIDISHKGANYVHFLVYMA